MERKTMIFPTQALVGHYTKIILIASVAPFFLWLKWSLWPMNSILICFVKKSKRLPVHAHCFSSVCVDTPQFLSWICSDGPLCCLMLQRVYAIKFVVNEAPKSQTKMFLEDEKLIFPLVHIGTSWLETQVDHGMVLIKAGLLSTFW